MQFRLDLTLSAAEGAVIRVLGMIERRGFTASSIHAERDAQGRWQLSMTVSGQRPGPTLAHQLEKIHDCLSVQVQPLQAGANNTAGIAA